MNSSICTLFLEKMLSYGNLCDANIVASCAPAEAKYVFTIRLQYKVTLIIISFDIEALLLVRKIQLQ